MTIEAIREQVMLVVKEFNISKVTLFGSRADGTNREDSDVDLIVEFAKPVSLLTISSLKIKLEDMLGIDVDIVHGPIQKTDIIEIGKAVELYAA